MLAAPNMLFSPDIVYDADALAYITAVQTADGAALELGVRKAINQLVLDLKSNSLWTPIKTMVVKMGARTLAGSLIDLKTPGSSWTNYNFTSGDYNRTTGLMGDGSTKYLDTGRNNNTDPQDNFSMFEYVTAKSNQAAQTSLLGANTSSTGTSNLAQQSDLTTIRARVRNSTTDDVANAAAVGLIGVSRSVGVSYTLRGAQTNNTVTRSSQTPFNGNIFNYARNNSPADTFSNHRGCAAGIGEAITLSTLETTLATFIASITALNL